MFIKKPFLLLIGVVVVVVMLGAGVGLAFALNALNQQKATTATLGATVTAQAAVTPIIKAQTGQQRVIGVIQSLNAQSFTMAVTVKKIKRNITVNVDTQTHYKLSEKNAAFRDLKVGETVAVVGTLDVKALTMQAMLVVIAPKAPTATPTPTASPTATATP